MKKTINDLYNKARHISTTLLATYPSAFWNDYRTNSNRYDALFNRMFFSFRYFLQNENDDVETVLDAFKADVYSHLLINDKKYSELYRIHCITDDEYSLTDNYNITETMDKDTSETSDNEYGARHDANGNVLGTQLNSVDTDTTYGEQTNVDTERVSPFNTEEYRNNNQMNNLIGSRHDDNLVTETLGSRTDSATYDKGIQKDNLAKTGMEDYVLTRKGNIGVQTVSDMLGKHKDFWTMWEFYEYIFKEICAELLLI